MRLFRSREVEKQLLQEPPPEYRPPVRIVSEVPVQSVRQRRMSQAAADAAQYVDSLESEVAALTHALDLERNSNSLLTEANKLLHEAKDALEHDNLTLRDAMARVRTKLQVSGSIVLDAMQEADKWPLAQEEGHDRSDDDSNDGAADQRRAGADDDDRAGHPDDDAGAGGRPRR